MRLSCKVAAALLCLGSLLLLYLLAGSAAAPPRPPPALSAPARPVAPLARRQPRLSRSPPRSGSKLASARKLGEQKHAREPSSLQQCMHLAVVACGDRLEETLIMLKSAILFSNRRLCFHIFAEDSLRPEFEKKLKEWPSSYTKKFEHHIYPITFSVGNAQEWKKLFKPCAAQRLFLPVILKDVDSLLYVDTDVLFLRPIEDIWHMLKEFNSTQLAAMAPEHEIPKIGWYSRFARHPYYGTTGVNSGVMLMNLTRIRSTQFKNSITPSGLSWEEMLYPLYQKYKNHITWGDQDLLNIIFYFNPVLYGHCCSVPACATTGACQLFSQTSCLPGDEIVFSLAQLAQLCGMWAQSLSLKSRIQLPVIFMRKGTYWEEGVRKQLGKKTALALASRGMNMRKYVGT
ncbi:glucoside xylosyltransferase 2 isoform X3 [Pogoniulus pusillus]|uniref:glucoside xylosyltransferase 2 isoform X3 n=1 Tax=Pogoniulus pusillus TaxID=488313 RepID=UPI0030B955FD